MKAVIMQMPLWIFCFCFLQNDSHSVCRWYFNLQHFKLLSSFLCSSPYCKSLAHFFLLCIISQLYEIEKHKKVIRPTEDDFNFFFLTFTNWILLFIVYKGTFVYWSIDSVSLFFFSNVRKGHRRPWHYFIKNICVYPKHSVLWYIILKFCNL